MRPRYATPEELESIIDGLCDLVDIRTAQLDGCHDANRALTAAHEAELQAVRDGFPKERR